MRQDVERLATAISNVTFKYLMVSCFRTAQFWLDNIPGLRQVEVFPARRASRSGSYNVRVFCRDSPVQSVSSVLGVCASKGLKTIDKRLTRATLRSLKARERSRKGIPTEKRFVR